MEKRRKRRFPRRRKILFRLLLCDERIVHRLTNYQSFLSYATSGCSSRLAALDSRLLKYSRILEISLPSTFPFSSISLSLWANIFQISIRSPSSKSRGDLKGDHPRRKIVHSSICKTMHDNRSVQGSRGKGFSRFSWPTASQPLSSIRGWRTRSEMNFSLFMSEENAKVRRK